MSENSVEVYGYRWVVLLLFMFINITIQILWITFASVTSVATQFYAVEELAIFILSATFMIAYIPVTFIASWLIDKYDFKTGTAIGAMIAGVFGLLRFFAGPNYMLVLIFQIGIAVGQPFLLNSVTKLSANWFPDSERTSATGLGLIAGFIGIALGLVLTPFLVEGLGFLMMLLIYGILGLVAGILFTALAKNRPPTPPALDRDVEKVFMFDGMKQLFKNKYFIIVFIVFFFGLGIFNTVTTYIEQIVIPRGYDSIYAGILGGLMLIGGIIGCMVMSTVSDKYHKRKSLLLISVLLSLVSLAIISFTSDSILLLVAGFAFGFGLMSASPVALEYTVEVTKPVPEATSNGLLMMAGQIGGIIFILGLEDFTLPNGDYFPALLLQTIFLFILLILTALLKEK
ncbi:MAG: MFS transporter [Candidatus Lokiarchaeota archaeon]|nr:MFS transporter [Candidatus Lokiarchaeota archaeon]MBD3343398.1 MFS transporter [Candidatus Lokiarchaeota archaeon]